MEIAMDQKGKLKPEHRRLWRRIYLNEFEVHNASPEESEGMADRVVALWERRGAFDEMASETATDTAFAAPMAVVMTGDPQSAYGIIQRERLEEHLFVALGKPSDGVSYVLIAKTPIGTKLASVALENNFRVMITHAPALLGKPNN